MINALAKLIYYQFDSLDTRCTASSGTPQITVPIFPLARISPSVGTDWILVFEARFEARFLAVCIKALIYACSISTPVFAQSATTTTVVDKSEVKIVIKPSDYYSFNLSQNSQRSGANKYVTLPEISRRTLDLYFGKQNPARQNDGHTVATTSAKPLSNTDTSDWLKHSQIEKKFLKPAGVFVTLSKHGKTRACWGSVYAREASIAKETEIATLGALSKDYRYKPISKTELADLKIQVTVIRAIEAVSDIKMIDPFKDGILVRSGGRGGVILPGEAVDAYYEFVLARLKAGIKPNEPCQIYKLKAEIYD